MTGTAAHGSPSRHAEWHAGERIMQEGAGSSEALAAAASRILKPELTQQMRDFLPCLSFLAIGYVDAQGRPGATLLPGAPGFAWSPDPALVRVDRVPPQGDPLRNLLKTGVSLGLLGIDLSTRRRNRINGEVCESDATGFTLRVEQSFGNCPKYIQKRTSTWPDSTPASVQAERILRLDLEARHLLRTSDTLFVASFAPGPHDAPSVDMSHRGGRPGFVRVDEDGTLTIPDFSGNRYFNTLGNILMTGLAAIVVPAFETGDLLVLSGEAVVEGNAVDESGTALVRGAERQWRLSNPQGFWLRGAFPPDLRSPDISPYAQALGTWPD